LAPTERGFRMKGCQKQEPVRPRGPELIGRLGGRLLPWCCPSAAAAEGAAGPTQAAAVRAE
jgi:hypothetical protein